MMKMKALLVMLFLFLFLIFPVSVSADVDKGKEVYEGTCLPCHGARGDSLKAMDVDFSSKSFWKDKTDEELINVIRNGKGGMPPFPKLSDEQMADLLEYMKSLTREPPSVTPPPASPTLTTSPTPTPTPVKFKKASSITCSVSPSKAKPGETITVSGSISPPRSGVTVTITYTKPDGSTITREATTNLEGKFGDTYKPEVKGDWKVKAEWLGDEEYEGAVSPTATFSIVECIIVTTTYGSELTPEVQLLRSFRDKVVLSTLAGSQFMQLFNVWYYSFSPSVAIFIADNPPVKETMKYVLYPLLGILHLSAAAYTVFNFNVEVGVVVAGLVASSLIGAIYFVPITLTTLLAVKRLRRRKLPKLGQLKPLTIPVFISLALLYYGEILTSPIIVMIATGTLVIFTTALSAGTIALKIARKL
jgi:cytochrome c553